jgi:molybdopterin-guanine dinucleotide biosynthesis adapter protein
MALVKPLIFQIVGYQNSGKTTIMTKILKQLKLEGLITVSIKHHGHGGMPDVNGQKDSAIHIDNGAIASIVEGNGRLLLQAEKINWTLQEKIQLMGFFGPDIILIEGHKKESYPKLLLIREKEDVEPLLKLDNIKLIMVWNNGMKEELAEKVNIPCIQIDDPSGIKRIVTFLQNELN